MKSISVGDLQHLPADTILTLSKPIEITQGPETVAMLVPFRRPDATKLRDALAKIDEAAAGYTPEENAAIERVLAERGIE